MPAETLENWDRGDIEVTEAAERYLRRGDPDAGFVYLGVVDETAHLVGSATPAYATAIATTDGRIGRLLRAIRSRASYPFESWTILVVTDHGERPLTEPSILAHFGKTKLELTSFLIGAGPGLGSKVKKPKVVDILPTVLHQLGLSTPRRWNIDGRTLSAAKPPSSATAKVRGGRLIAKLSLGSRPKARGIDFHLPHRAHGAATVRVNGAPAAATIDGKTLRVALRGRRLHTISLAVDTAAGGRSLVVVLRGAGGKMAIPLR